MSAALASAMALVVLASAACQGLPRDEGLAALLRVADAQYLRGDLEMTAHSPSAADAVDAPAVISVFNSLTTIVPGERNKPLVGTLGTSATAVALGLRGDRGYWIAPARAPGLDAPEFPSFQVALSFSPALPAGDTTLLVSAVNEQGRIGAPSEVALVSALPSPPMGALVMSLAWDTEADLDLHVVSPDGVEIWAGNINSYERPPPGTASDPMAWQSGGLLDLDSNAGCVIDGRRRENVVWQARPAAGTYVVRVDSPSLCGAPAARWKAQVLLDGNVVAESEGTSLPGDARFSKGRGSGLEALRFDVPAL